MFQDKLTEIVGSFGTDGQFGKAFLVAFFVLVLLFFALREFVCWYFRLSRMVDLMKINNAQLEQLTAEMSSLRKSLSATSPAKVAPLPAAPEQQRDATKDWTS